MFNRRSITVMALSSVLALGAAGPVAAKHGADDSPSHQASDDHSSSGGKRCRHRSGDDASASKRRRCDRRQDDNGGDRPEGVSDDGPNHT